MLPAPHRLRRSSDFDDAVRGGARSGSRRLVVHLLTDPDPSAAPPARAGVVVSKAVGGAVQRNTVKRRLRGLLSDRVEHLDPGTRLVVRALPPAQGASSTELGYDLDTALAGARRRALRRREGR